MKGMPRILTHAVLMHIEMYPSLGVVVSYKLAMQ